MDSAEIKRAPLSGSGKIPKKHLTEDEIETISSSHNTEIKFFNQTEKLDDIDLQINKCLKQNSNLNNFILSCKWIQARISNHNIQNQIINFDLIDHEKEKEFINNGGILNKLRILTPNLKEKTDFILVDKETIDSLSRKYEIIILKSKKINLNQVLIHEIYPSTFPIIIITNYVLKKIDNNKIENFDIKQIKIFSTSKIQKLKKEIINYYDKTYNSLGLNSDMIRIWRHDFSLLSNLFQSFKKMLISRNSYTIEFEGNFLDVDDKTRLNELFLKENEGFIIDIKSEIWNLLKNNESIGKCDHCYKNSLIEFRCSCEQVKYCSKNCQIRDRNYHASRCENGGESEDEKKAEDFTFTNKSVKGLCGLHNLGNSCYMNSALQCLSHTKELTQYFIEKKYLNDLNSENKLGKKGKLAKKYADLLKKLWCGERHDIHPTGLRNLFANKQFSEYSQEDSHEFLSFFLDGLHEDLNRVKEKVYLEIKDEEGKSDELKADEYWQYHLKRNDSIIVDLTHGQFKSQIRCPDCKKNSISFDPFLICSLPLPSTKSKKIEIYLTRKDSSLETFKFIYYLNEMEILIDVKKKIAEMKKINYLCLESAKLCANEVSLLESEKIKILQLKQELKKDSLVLFFFEKENEKINIQDYFQINLFLWNCSYSFNKKRFSFPRVLFFAKNTTFREIHLKILSYFRILFEDFDEKKINILYKKYFGNKYQKPYQIYYVPLENQNFECVYCNDRFCRSCEFPDNEKDQISIVLKKLKKNILELNLYFNTNKENFRRLSSISSLETNKPKENEKNISIYDCLKLFSQEEILEENNEWYCSICKQHKKASKKIEFFRLPPILIFHLKRFKTKNNEKRKKGSFVDIPLINLDLKDFLIKEKKIENNTLYELYGIIDHKGSMGYGHYISKCKNPLDGQWHKFDDEEIRIIDEKNVVTENAYILFFRRK